MTQKKNIYIIYPSVIRANNSNCIDTIPIALTLKGSTDDWCCDVKTNGSLADLEDVLNEHIEAANESCGGQYLLELDSDFDKHCWESLQAFYNDRKRRDYNKIAVFCCPLTYLKEQNIRKPRGEDPTLLINRIDQSELSQCEQLQRFYIDNSSNEAKFNNSIHIFETLDYAAETWLEWIEIKLFEEVRHKTSITGKGRTF